MQVFTQYLADEIQDEITKQIRASRYISILVDGSTDRSTLEKEVVYCEFQENNMPVMKFLGGKDTGSTTAEGILDSFYINVLAELSYLSLTIQKDGISLPTAVEAVRITEQVLKDMEKHDGQELKVTELTLMQVITGVLNSQDIQ